MADEQPSSDWMLAHGHQWLTALASLIVGAAFFALWFWLLPGWLGFRVEATGRSAWRWLAAIPSVVGFAIALRCVWDFGWTGHGTPAPVAPPQRLVAVGFYRYVRNPMYLGFATGWIGLWVVFGHANPVAIAAVLAIALGVHLFVVFYEEPTLRKKFGSDYINYCQNVDRWWPRLRGWDEPQTLERSAIAALATDQSNAAKRRNQMMNSSSKQPEDQPNAHIPGLAESAAKPQVATKASSWPVPKRCVVKDDVAEPHIFVGGIPAAPPKDKE